MAVITVTATRLGSTLSGEWFWRAWMESDFDNYYVGAGGAGGGSSQTIEAVAVSQYNDFEIAPKDGLPKITLKNATLEQYNDLMSQLNNIGNDPELKAQFIQMAQNKNFVDIVVAENLPPDANPNARAIIRFKPYSTASDFSGNDEIVMPQTGVTIIVKASKISNSGTWEDTWKGIIAHEFTHLKRDSNGRFLDDHYDDGYTGLKTTDKDDETFLHLQSKLSGASYSDSLEITLAFDPIYGTPTFVGTSGNNLINMGLGLSAGNVVATASTGAGNDMIIGGLSGFETITVDGDGRKVLVQEGLAYDQLQMLTLDTIANLVVTYIGQDTYLTLASSSFAPVDDPNAVVIVGMIEGERNNAIDYVHAADGTFLAFHPLSAYRAAQDQPADQSFAQDFNATLFQMDPQAGGLGL